MLYNKAKSFTQSALENCRVLKEVLDGASLGLKGFFAAFIDIKLLHFSFIVIRHWVLLCGSIHILF